MRRSSDKVALAALVVALLCAAVVAANLAPAVLDTSSRATDAEETAKANRRVIAQVDRALRRIDRESEIRERQFCGLVLGVHRDRVKRLRNTRAFFRTAAGRERTSLNGYIKAISLPQLEREVVKERARLPDVCLK